MVESDRIGPTLAESRYKSVDQRSKTLKLLELCRELLDIGEVDGLLRIRRSPDVKTIELLADHVIHMWPKDWRPSENQVTDGLTLLYWGPHTPNAVANGITRLSLYADRLLVVNPFAKYFLHHPNHSPTIHPELWTHEFGVCAIYLALLEPWIREGLVELVQNPCVFDLQLFEQLSKKMVARLSKNGKIKELMESQVANNELFVEFLLQHPRNLWQGITDSLPLNGMEKSKMLAAAELMVQNDPIRGAIPYDLQRNKQSIMGYGSGLSYEQAALVASEYGSSVVASDDVGLHLMAADTLQFQQSSQQTAQLFSDLKLNFFNNVPSKFAIDVRRSGRLTSFRNYLTTLSRGVKLVKEQGVIDEQARREFGDKFSAEFAQYKEDWADIQRKLAFNSAAAITGTFASAVAISQGSLSLLGISAAALMPIANSTINTVFERRKLERQPLNIALKLEHAG